MKTLTSWLLVFNLLTPALGADPATGKSPGMKAVTVDVPDGKSLEVMVPDSWSVQKVQPDASLPPTLRLTSKDKDAGVQITFIPDKEARFSTRDQIEQAVKAVGARFAGSSVEKETKVKDLGSKAGIGVIAQFTDASLVGKPAEPGKFHVVGTGLLKIGTTAAAFTIVGNAFDHPAYVEGKQIVASMSEHK
jgi:hypothetical protein